MNTKDFLNTLDAFPEISPESEIDKLIQIHKGDNKLHGEFTLSYLQKFVPLVKAQAYRARLEVDDLLQEAYLALFFAAKEYNIVRAEATFNTYAHCKVKGALLDTIKKSISDFSRLLFVEMESDTVDYKNLKSAVQSLPREERIVVQGMFGVGGGIERSWEELQQLLSVSKGRLARIRKAALDKLKMLLKEDG